MNKLREWVASGATIAAHRTKETYFTRNTARLSFARLISFVLGNNHNSAQVALNDFFRKEHEEPVAKQTLFEARDKISYKAFSELNEQIVSNFYSEGDAGTYKSYTLLAVDGSLFQAPQGALSVFGGQKSAKCETVSAQARAVAFTDVLNRIIVTASLKPVSNGEQKIFLEMLEDLRSFKRVMLIFDRGFYSKTLAEAIQKKGMSFLFRIKRRCQKDIDAANEPDQTIVIENGVKLRIVNVSLRKKPPCVAAK